MISEGSCDTEDWSNDAENTALITGINYILQYIQIENQLYILVFVLSFIKCSPGEHKTLNKYIFSYFINSQIFDP